MPKIKTRKTAAKRFKVTGTGKVLRSNTGRGHLMINKSGSRKRRLRMDASIFPGEMKKIHRLLPGI